MTRGELRDDIFDIVFALNARIGTAEAWRTANDILALLDRYEAEQWKPATEPPEDGSTVLLRKRSSNEYKCGVWSEMIGVYRGGPFDLYPSDEWEYRVLSQPPKEVQP